MKKNLIMTIFMVTVLAGLNACCCKVVSGVLPGKVEYSPTLVQTIDDMNIQAAILVDADGNIHLYNQYGTTERVKDCLIPEPDAETVAAERMARPAQIALKKAGAEVCQGMTKGSTVTSIRSIFIMKTNSDNCLGFGGDGGGGAREICW